MTNDSFRLATLTALLTGGLAFVASLAFGQEPDIDPASGLVMDDGWQMVQAHCGACHSLNLVKQNRGDSEHWLKLIHWMQAKHNLWDLGPAEEVIVSYLAQHYGAPDVAPRRQLLETTWLDEQGQ